MLIYAPTAFGSVTGQGILITLITLSTDIITNTRATMKHIIYIIIIIVLIKINKPIHKYQAGDKSLERPSGRRHGVDRTTPTKSTNSITAELMPYNSI